MFKNECFYLTKNVKKIGENVSKLLADKGVTPPLYINIFLDKRMILWYHLDVNIWVIRRMWLFETAVSKESPFILQGRYRAVRFRCRTQSGLRCEWTRIICL